MLLANTFKDKTVVVTGHTGFKGSWLSLWLLQLGAKVVGIALDPPSVPSHFDTLNLAKDITDLRLDIRNSEGLNEAILSAKPDYLFHLAAQSLVSKSYEFPVETWEINLLGTVNILEALSKLDKKCISVIITSDKCYENLEWVWGYRENDRLGGYDHYSASKGAAELAIRSYVKSHFQISKSKIRIASARAGNVIGGGDWAANRIVPDCIKAWAAGKPIKLRNPESTRPWQHVLEPLSGYLALAIALEANPKIHGESFNFGPQDKNNYRVIDLIKHMSLLWKNVEWIDMSNTENDFYEAGLLKLNCDKSLYHLDWFAILGFEQVACMTVEWYKAFYENPKEVFKITQNQIKSYTEFAEKSNLKWAQ